MNQQTIYLIRHAESAMPGKFCGSTNVGLSPTGLKQAKKLTHYFKSIQLDSVIHSGMKRTEITAAHIHKNKNIPILKCPDIREYHFGEWESHDFPFVKKNWPDLYSKWTQSPFQITIPGAETFAGFTKRVGKFAKYLKNLKTKNSVVVAHGGSLAILMMKLFNHSADHIWKWLPSPASITILKRPLKKSTSSFDIALLKDTSHL